MFVCHATTGFVAKPCKTPFFAGQFPTYENIVNKTIIVSLCHTSAKPFFHGGTLMKFMDMYPFFFYSIWVLGCFSKLTRKNIEILTKTSRGPRAGSDQKLPDVDEK